MASSATDLFQSRYRDTFRFNPDLPSANYMSALFQSRYRDTFRFNSGRLVDGVVV